MKQIEYVYSGKKYVKSFNKTLDSVARERKYLAKVEGHSLEQSEGFLDFLISNNYPQYFAICENEVVGWCDAAPYGFEGMKHVAGLGMGVLSDFRGKGVGKKLMELTINHAKEKNGVEKIELEVFGSNSNAIEFYKKHGFEIEGRKVRTRKLDGAYDDLLVMGKFL